jgi:site-specific DNA-methyltransferase (adenine-specific)
LPALYRLGNALLYAGDCRDSLAKIGPVDAVVTDPPYHVTSVAVAWDTMPLNRGKPRITKKTVGFMGKGWDGGDIAFRPETWSAIAAALKPGGYLLAFGGTRTHHRIWTAVEDAGLVIQDTIMWLYGQGFPKGRTQLKPAFEPIVVAYKPGAPRELQIDECGSRPTSTIPAATAKIAHRVGIWSVSAALLILRRYRVRAAET